MIAHVLHSGILGDVAQRDDVLRQHGAQGGLRLGRQGGLAGKGIVVPVQLAQLDLNALGGNGEMVDLFLGRIAQQRQGGSNGDHSHETERQGNGENTFLFHVIFLLFSILILNLDDVHRRRPARRQAPPPEGKRLPSLSF